ncbi:MAG: methyltransferase [Bradymonadia bacterium]
MQNPARIVEISTAYWQSATLMAAIQLRIPSLIGEGSLSARQLANQAECDETALLALLEGLCSLDLLTRNGDSFSNAEITKVFLVDASPTYMGSALLYNADVYPKWASLAETIKSGKPVHSPNEYLGDTETQTRNFVYGMHHRALSVGRAVINLIDLKSVKTLLDVGGGPGTYSALLAAKYPSLSATVADLPPVIAHARNIVSSMSGGERVNCIDFDYYQDRLEGSYDAILISGVLHREQPDGVRSILSKATTALNPGGILYISDVMVNDERTGPLFSTMFSINMRVLANHGRAHSVKEQSAYLNELGLTVTTVNQLPAPIHYTIIRAEKA